jgi:hypothetical protein
MKNLWNSTVAGVAGWKLVWARAFLTTLVAGLTVITAALQGLEWNLLTGTQKFVIIGGVLLAMSNNLVSFLSDTMKELNEKKDEKIKL